MKIELETKYNIGQVVFTPLHKEQYHKLFCGFCNGDKRVYYLDSFHDCPACHGDGYIRIFTGYKWEASNPLVINEVIVYKAPRIKISTDYIIDNVKGIFTLRYPEDNLYYTKEECQLECDRRNKDVTN